MLFLAERINEGDFSMAKAASTSSDGQYETSQVNVTFTHPKNKQSITLQLYEHTDEAEKLLFLSKVLLQVCKRNDALNGEVKIQQAKIKELSSKTQRTPTKSSFGNRSFHGTGNGNGNQKTDSSKVPERLQMSLINPAVKRRKTATGVSYDDEESD